jgi:hypothetical protein
MVKHEGLWPKANGLSITAKIVTDDDGDDDDGDDSISRSRSDAQSLSAGQF